MKKALIRTAQAIFTIAILIYLFNSPEKRAQMGAAFGRADAHWMLIGLPVAFAGEIANIIRWNILLRVQGMRIGWLRLSQLFLWGCSLTCLCRVTLAAISLGSITPCESFLIERKRWS